ncbi:MAG: glycosyltransferase family 1 protein, partial [Nitrospirae bacterium]
MNALKIIMVIHSNIFGGAERHSVLLAKGLKEKGHEVTFVCPKNSWTWKALEGFPIKKVNLPLNGTYDMYSLGRLIVLAKKSKANLLHGHLTRSAFYVNWASRLSGIPAVVSAHATNTHKHFQGARKIIAVSYAVKEHLVSKGYSPQKIEVVYNGVEDLQGLYGKASRQVRRQLGLKDDEVAIVLLGRFIKDKGHDIALETVKGLPDLSFRLFFIGNDNTEWGRYIKNLVRKYGLEKRVVFLGHREDARQLLCAMDLMVQPSRREALGLSVLEAMSAGLPVVASNVGGLPEVIRDGVNGFLFELKDKMALIERLKDLIVNKKLRVQLSTGARKTYLERFTVE